MRTITLAALAVLSAACASAPAGSAGSGPVTRSDLTALPAGDRLIETGETRTGVLGAGDAVLPDGSFAQRWRLRATSPGEYLIELASPDFDAYLFVFGEATRVLTDNDSGGGGAALIEVMLEDTGDYDVIVNTAAAGQAGSFTLTVREK